MLSALSVTLLVLLLPIRLLPPLLLLLVCLRKAKTNGLRAGAINGAITLLAPQAGCLH